MNKKGQPDKKINEFYEDLKKDNEISQPKRYTCSKCKFTSTNLKSYRAHYISLNHRLSYQYMFDAS